MATDDGFGRAVEVRLSSVDGRLADAAVDGGRFAGCMSAMAGTALRRCVQLPLLVKSGRVGRS